MIVRRALSLVAVLLLGTLPAAAAGMGLRGWGPRVGLAAEPDQVIGGAHFDVGDVAPQLRLVPNFQIGLGDDATVLEGTLPLHYVFSKANTPFAPYVGGGLAVAWFDFDGNDGNNGNDGRPDGDDSEVELGVKAIGGLEWNLGGRKRFLVELNLGIGDIHDFQAVAGWTF